MFGENNQASGDDSGNGVFGDNNQASGDDTSGNIVVRRQQPGHW